MNTEELLMPRWKVIADWPGSKYWGIGDVLLFEKCEHGYYYEKWCPTKSIWYEDYKPMPKQSFKNYPHLFRKLEWWEDRNTEDMPEYLKYFDEDGKLEFVLKVEKYKSHKDSGLFWCFEYFWENEPDVKRMSLTGWIPATKEEYDANCQTVSPTGA